MAAWLELGDEPKNRTLKGFHNRGGLCNPFRVRGSLVRVPRVSLTDFVGALTLGYDV